MRGERRIPLLLLFRRDTIRINDFGIFPFNWQWFTGRIKISLLFPQIGHTLTHVIRIQTDLNVS